VAKSEYNLAILKLSEGKKGEAAALYRHAAEVYGREYGPDHSETLDAVRQVRSCEDEDADGGGGEQVRRVGDGGQTHHATNEARRQRGCAICSAQ